MLFRLPGLRATQAAFRGLDEVNLVNEFSQRACVMHTVPRFLRGLFSVTCRVGRDFRRAQGHERRQERGWKLFLLLRRMLFHRPRRPKLVARFEMFLKGEWTGLLKASAVCATQAACARQRKRQRPGLDHRVSRAEALVHMGELSSARQALEGASLAPGTDDTLVALRRAAVVRDAIPEHLIRSAPEVPFALDEAQLNKNLRSAKRGAAPGPSGMTVEHLHPLLDHCGDLRMFFAVVELLARGQVPESIQVAVKLGCMTALTEPEGGVRGIVQEMWCVDWWPERCRNN